MMPDVINLPTEHHDGYLPAIVIAAIPLSDGKSFPLQTYAVTAIDPGSPSWRPSYIAAETSRNSTAEPWFTDETFPSDNLPDALGDMASLAGRVYPRFL